MRDILYTTTKKDGIISTEKAIICFSEYSANVFKSSLIWCVDATFSTSPNKFAQQFEFMVLNHNTEEFEVCVVIYMSSKSTELYYRVFSSLKNWFCFHKQISLKPRRVICDFEKAMINTIEDVFKPEFITGCYFHAIKNWWKKASKLGKFILFFQIINFRQGLRNKEYIIITKLVIQSFKIWGHLEITESRNSLKTAIDEIFNKDSELMKNLPEAQRKLTEKLISYWEKNYFKENSKFGKYCVWRKFDDEPVNIRANNYLEGFHNKLKSVVRFTKPALSVSLNFIKQILDEQEESFKQHFFGESKTKKRKSLENEYIVQKSKIILKLCLDEKASTVGIYKHLISLDLGFPEYAVIENIEENEGKIDQDSTFGEMANKVDQSLGELEHEEQEPDESKVGLGEQNFSLVKD